MSAEDIRQYVATGECDDKAGAYAIQEHGDLIISGIEGLLSNVIGLPVEEVFKQVRASVRRESNNQQTPWENTALEGQFYFRAPVQAAGAPPG